MSKPVVARFKDGRVLKGVSMDIDPSRPTFHLRPPQGSPVQVSLSELKALFFVRSLDGDPQRSEEQTPDPADPRARGSSIVALRFADGEAIVGLTIRYPPNKPFFFVLPVDPGSNNIRILVNRDAVVAMEAKSAA
jgi:Family of unknown function (DUF6982)